MVKTRLAKAHGAPGFKLNSNDSQSGFKTVEIVTAARLFKYGFQKALNAVIVKNPGGQQPAQAVQALQTRHAARITNESAGHFQHSGRHAHRRLSVFTQSGAHKLFRYEGILSMCRARVYVH